MALGERPARAASSSCVRPAAVLSSRRRTPKDAASPSGVSSLASRSLTDSRIPTGRPAAQAVLMSWSPHEGRPPMGRGTERSRTVASARWVMFARALPEELRRGSCRSMGGPRSAEGNRPWSTRCAAGYPSGLQGVEFGGLPTAGCPPIPSARPCVTQVLPGTTNTPFFDRGQTKLGVKPVGIPPIYEPETVANVVVYASENPARDLVSGGAVRALTPKPAPLSTHARRRPRNADRLQPSANRRAEVRARSRQPLRPDTRARHGEERVLGVLAKPLQLAGDPPDG